jgi:hypothetical protein
VALPEQIRKQDEAVQELYKQINGEGDTPEKQETAPVQDEVAPEPEVGLQDSETADDNVAEETADSAPSPTGGDKSGEETLLQKYRTLQGMYNAEVPRLHQQNKELGNRIQQMEQLLASMSKPENKPAQPPTPEKYITEEDVAEYGDSLEVMRKVSREEVGPVMAKLAAIEKALGSLQSDVVPQIQAVSKRQAASAEQQFWADLTSAVPDWREINDVQEFQNWLLEVDPLTGINRQTYLEDAQRQLDARRVASFFTTWMNISGRANTARSDGTAPTRKAQSELEKQVSPGRSRNTGTPAPNKGKMWTPVDITKFFDAVRSGKYKGREAERDQIERDIFAAQREGRIQPNA